MTTASIGSNISSLLTLNTGVLQGCVLSPILYSLYTYNCVTTHSSSVIVKFSDDTMVLGLITDNDETAYREEVRTLTHWCQENNLSLNINKTKELVVDFRRQDREHNHITIDGTQVERVSSFKFLGVHITEDLTWSTQTEAVVKKAHQHLFFLGWLTKSSFYTCLHRGEHPDRLHHLLVSPPAPPSTAKLCRECCGQPGTLPEECFLPSKTSTPGNSSSFSEGPADTQSRQQKVKELLKNPSLKRDMHLAVQQSLHDKLLELGIEPAVGGLSKTTFDSAMARVVSERQQRQRECAEYRKMQKVLSQNLDRRVKERSTRPVAKPKQSGHVRTLPQSRPRSNSLPVTVTKVVSGPLARRQYTPQPAHQNNTATRPTTSTQMAPHKIPLFSQDEDSSEEEESNKDSPQAQKATVKSHSPGVQQRTAPPALASFQKAAQSSGSQQAPVFSKMEVTVQESESEWTEGSEMEEISLDQLQKHTDQNGNVPKTSCSYVKALSNNLEKQPADQGHKKTAGIAIPDKPAGVTNTNDAVWEIKHTDFVDDNDDDWDISSLEDVPPAHKSSSAPVKNSIDKSLDTSTSVWGTFTGRGQEPGLKDTGSTLKSSIVTVSDWDDSDGT
ncbi:hypothetical protein PGIGA_G00105110 [Pangasianodon gigas]|uniref:Uncharacterized protein n=1 Tax=Pangasianodon gigas TaxID=30993 RepID=A0ACC5W7T1_PANGG|nr:hypothetical protein [Pangasianodon gigas]